MGLMGSGLETEPLLSLGCFLACLFIEDRGNEATCFERRERDFAYQRKREALLKRERDLERRTGFT